MTMRRSIFFSIVFVFTTNLDFGQLFQFGPSPIKLIEKGDLIEADKRINKDIVKTPDDVETNFAMSLLLSKRIYSNYSSDKSYDYFLRSKKLFEAIKDDKEIKKLAKIPIDNALFTNFNDTVCRLGMEDVLAKNSLDFLEKYLETYQTSPEKYRNEVIKSRDVAAFKIASEKNTLESYQHFISKYPDAIQNPEAIQHRNEAAFQKAKAIDEIVAYQDFIQRYPSAKEFLQAWSRIHEIAFINAEKENTSKSYKRFIDEYPQSKQYNQAFAAYEKKQYQETIVTGDWNTYMLFIENFPTNSWKVAAQDSIYSIAIRTENLDILRYCLTNFTGTKRNTALVLYHDIFTIDGEVLTLDMFYAKYNDDFLIPYKTKDYEIAALGNELNFSLPYTEDKFAKYDSYIKIAAPREKAFTALQKMITVDMDAKNYAAALTKAKTYLSNFGTKNKKLLDLISFLETR